MEISKSLQEEIQAIQNKLKNAIQNHQVYVGKLNSDPNNEELIAQIQDIQEHIISLSKCQKQVVQRLRKEVKLYEAANTNGNKVSIATLLGLNNNNNITNNNETKSNRDNSDQNTDKKNSEQPSRESSKDDYEDGIRNVELQTAFDDSTENSAKTKASVGESDANYDEEVVEVSQDEDSSDKRDTEQCCKMRLSEQLDFLSSLGLITSQKHAELQNRRAERKRRSTANPQFVYSNWELPTKRKRHSYLQSNGSAPQTRQTTARLNGPSPPPTKGTARKSTPPSGVSAKSLIPTQKSTTRPNILRNNSDSKVFASNAAKNKADSGSNQVRTPSAKAVQAVGNKAVHIPGLPSSLTIERIENDPSVCIQCGKAGFMTSCEICSASYHISCHTVTPAYENTCPKCVEKTRELDDNQDSSSSVASECKRDDEIATTSRETRVAGKTGEDTEVHKTSGGLHKVDAAQDQRPAATISINQLPSSTFLIPLAATSIPSSVIGVNASAESIVPSSVDCVDVSNGNASYSSVVINQLPQPSLHPEVSTSQVSYAYQLPVVGVQPENSTSYLIVKKLSEPGCKAGRNKQQQQQQQQQQLSTIHRQSEDHPKTCSVFSYQQSVSTGYNDHDQFELRPIPAPVVAPSADRKLKTSVESKGKRRKSLHSDIESRVIRSESCSTNRKGADKLQRKSLSKFSINKLRPNRNSNAFIPLHSIINESGACDGGGVSKRSEPPRTKQLAVAAPKAKSKNNLLYSLFSGNNEPNSFAPRPIKPKIIAPDKSRSKLDEPPSTSREPNLDAPVSPTRLYSSSPPRFTEYVKLEEAHLPAPLGSKLAWQTVAKSLDPGRHDDDDDDDDDDSSAEETAATSDGDEKSGPSCEILKQRLSHDASITLERIDEPINDAMTALTTRLADYDNENLRSTHNFIEVEKKHSSAYALSQFRDLQEYDELCSRTSGETRQQDYKLQRKYLMPSLPKDKVIQRTFPVLRNRILLPEGKGESNRSIDDKWTANNNSEKEAREVAAIPKALTGQETNSKLGINIVSTENMMVLEQFESAMLDVDETDDAHY